jgi:hypothetical protein
MGLESIIEIDNVIWISSTDGAHTDAYFELALERALAMLSNHCILDQELLLARIAPIEFKKLDPSVLMQTNVQFLLEKGVWIPMSLAIQQESDASRMSELMESCEHDFKITVNTDIDFVTNAHGCVHPDGGNSVALDAATTTLLHELLHGLGIYSLVDGNIGGGFEGAISLYDTLLRHSSNNVMVFSSPYYVQTISGQHLTHYDLSVAGHIVFNPFEFAPGRSFAHLDGEGVMGVGRSNMQCLLKIDDATIDVLGAIGWQCTYASSDIVHSELTPSGDSVCIIESECLCVVDQMCMDCDDADQLDRCVTVSLISAIVLSLLLWLAICYSTDMQYTDIDHVIQSQKYVSHVQRVPSINNF